MSHPHHPTLLHNRLPYFGRTGLVRNGLVAEYRFDESKNLLKYSQQFDNSAWTKTNCAIAANDTAAPDGTTTADKVTLTVGAAQSIAGTYTVVAATAYTFSIWVKLGTATALKYAIYDVSNSGDITAATSYGATTSWVRYAIPFTTPAGCTSVSIRPVKDSAQENGTTAWIWGAQLEAGSAARTYYPTTDKQLLMDYSRPRKNLLLPNQANACEDGTTGGFTINNSATLTAPSGEIDEWQGSYCLKIVSAALKYSGGYITTYGQTPTKSYTVSIYARGATGGEIVLLRLREITDSGSTVETTESDPITLTTEWQRITLSRTLGATGRGVMILFGVSSATASTFYVDGLQLEEGSTATAWEAPPNIGISGSTTGADTNDPTYTGQGASFTTDDYINGTNISDLSQYTILAVVSPTSTSGWGCICSKNTGSSAGAGKSGFFLERGAGDLNLRQYDSNGDLCSATKPNALSASSWCMAIGVCDGINVYCGTANSPLAKSSTSMSAVAPNNTLNVRVGAYAYTSSIFWEGSVAYLAIYNRVLTQAEISQNYNYLKGYLLRERGISI